MSVSLRKPHIKVSLEKPLDVQIRRAIARLGNTADAIANNLRARGITGEHASTDACPLAVYLNQFGPLTVKPDHVETWGESIPLPDAAVAFIAAFDREGGPYADLITPEPDYEQPYGYTDPCECYECTGVRYSYPYGY
jgi:hypothetical protein